MMASEEYTIDIQLTELGFPNIMLASSDTSSPPSSPSPPPPPQSADEESPRGGVADVVARVPGGQIQISMVRGTTPSATRMSQSASLPPPPARRGVAATGASSSTRPLVNGLDRTTRGQPGNRQEHTATGQAYGGASGRAGSRGGVELEEEESDSDDSEVSEVEEEEEEDEDVEGEGLNVDIESTSGEYRCSVCELTLPSSIKLQEHMNLHTGTRPYCCAECGKRFCQIYNYRLHLRTHAQTRVTKPVVCRICLKDFDTEVQLQFHFTQNHFEKEFYECDLCKRIFTDLRLCEQHMEWHQRSVRCETCGRTFHSDRSLKRHRHKRCQRTYNCTDCPLKFSRKNALLKHSFTHLGLLPYTCIRCQRHFRLAKLYRQHKCEPQSIHCVACLRVFYNQVDFQKHKKDTGCWGHQGSKGDEIRCMECGKSFATKEELKKHAGVHQRLLSCAECGKGFHSALLLMSHMGGHAGQSPCLCQRCGLGFPHQQEYDGHLKHCGRARPPAGAPKKRPPSSKTPAPPAKKLRPGVTEPTAGVTVVPSVPQNSLVSVKPPVGPVSAKPPSSVNLAVGISSGLSNGPALRLDQTCGPPQGVSVGGGGPAGGGPSGVWQIALDKKPPPGANLVLFVPVASPLANGLAGINPAHQPLTLLQPHQLSVALQSAAGGGGGDVSAALHKATSLIPGLMPGLSRLTDAIVTQLQAGAALGSVDDGADMMPLDLSTKKPAPVESTSSSLVEEPSSSLVESSSSSLVEESSSLDAPRPSVKKEPESPEELVVADGEAAFQCTDADSKQQQQPPSEVKRETRLGSVRADGDEPLEVKSEVVTAAPTPAGLDTVDESMDDVDSAAGELTVDLDAVDETAVDLDDTGELTVDLDDDTGELTVDLDDTGELTVDLDTVDETTADLDDTAGETTADLDTAAGELIVDLDTVHETSADLDTAGESKAELDTAVDESTADPDTAGQTKHDADEVKKEPETPS